MSKIALEPADLQVLEVDADDVVKALIAEIRKLRALNKEQGRQLKKWMEGAKEKPLNANRKPF